MYHINRSVAKKLVETRTMEKQENEVLGQQEMSRPWVKDTFDPSWSDEGIVELQVLSLSTKYPERLQKYLQQSVPNAQQLLSEFGFTYILDDTEKLIRLLSTTTKEPAIIRRAKEFLQLLAVNMPVEFAATLFTGQLSSCIVNIDGIAKDFGINLDIREKLFWECRDELTEFSHVKISIQRNIVVVGKSKAVKKVRNIAIGCLVFNESPTIRIRIAKWKLERKKKTQARRRQLYEDQHQYSIVYNLLPVNLDSKLKLF